MKNKTILSILKNQVKLSLGCTEPVAVGLAVSTAYREINGEVIDINLRISPNVYKNGLRVGIPGTDQKGIEFATALSILCGDPNLKLELFKNVNDYYIEEANKLIVRNIINIDIEKNKDLFFIEAKITTDKGNSCCRIRGNHTNVVYLEANGTVIYDMEESKINENKLNNDKLNLREFNIIDLIKFAEDIPLNDIAFLQEGSIVNMKIAHEGLKLKNKTGYGLNNLIDKNLLKNDMVNQVRIFTTSACDARMSGMNLPVMSSAGSGNQGITAIIPPTVICNNLGCSDEKLLRSLAISHLITAYIKEFTGNLSPVCGCSISAGVGATASITWLLNGSYNEIINSMNNMIGSLSGMICDGAKGGCAYKLSIASSEAVIQAFLAINGITIKPFDGIIGNSIEDTIKNLGFLSTEGMKNIDNTILKIMTN